jgi:hypothetical protein
VTVTAFNNGWATVKGEGGKQAEVFIVNIECGWDEWVDGKWRERQVG